MQDNLERAAASLEKGQSKKAFREAKAAMRQLPNSPDPWNLAGLALSLAGDHSEAAKYFFKATRLAPSFDNAQRNLAQALVLSGQPDKAHVVLTRFLERVPKDEAAWYLLAQCAFAKGDLSGATTAIETAMSLGPKSTRNRLLSASIKEKSGDLPGAIAACEAVLALDPAHVDALLAMSTPLARQLRVKEAREALEKAVRSDPAHIWARVRLGLHLVEAGETEGAIQAFRGALSRDPTQATAIEQLAQLETGAALDDLTSKAVGAIKGLKKRSEDRASLQFALAHIARRKDDLKAEDAALRQANADMRSLTPYDIGADSARVARIRDRFASEIILAPTEPAGIKPIFVVGLPRSGTTLVEAILGAHSRVQPLGERAAAGMLLNGFLDTDAPFDEGAIATFRKGDADLMPDLPDDAAAYVDKMPENYRLLGFLKSAYPDCAIINLVRDPRDIALSMWRGHFAGSALSYTYDLHGMAGRFNLYADLMTHWRRVLPGQILDVPYEALVQDVEGMSKSIAAFCDLEWTPEMAAPHKSASQVMTLSAQQVRAPVHDRSVAGWTKHEAMLGPFIAALDARAWDGYLADPSTAA